MGLYSVSVYLFWALLFISSNSLKTDDSLDFRYVDENYVHTLFSFSIEEEITTANYGYFPRQIGSIINKYNIDEFKVSVSRGHWRWNIDLNDDIHSKRYILPAGGLLEAVKTSDKFTKKSWSDFTHELAGVTCSSFNRIDFTVTGWSKNKTKAFGQLPAEAVCTENLTPWLRLLKTSRKQNQGLLGLIKQNIYKFQESNYFGLTIDTKIQGNTIKMTQTLSAVWKTKHSKSCSLADIFGKNLNTIENRNAIYPLRSSKNFKKDIDIKRYLTANGRGQLGGVINTEIKHDCDSSSNILELHLIDVLPWCVAPFLSSFKSNGSQISSMNWNGGKIRKSPYQIEYVAQIKRCESLQTSFEFESKLLGWTNYPADAERGIFINPAIVTLVNHASSIHSSGATGEQQEQEAEENTLTTTETRGNGEQKHVVLYSTGLIIDVPKPDFSMPFNALCLACTAVAILFGNVHSVCTKSVEISSESNEKFVVKLGKKIKDKLASIFKRKSEEKPEENQKNTDKND